MPDSKQLLIDADLHRRLKAHVASLGLSTMKAYVESVLEHAMVTNGEPMAPPPPDPDREVDPSPQSPDVTTVPEPDPDPEPDPEPIPMAPPESPPTDDPKPDGWGVAASGTSRVRGDDW